MRQVTHALLTRPPLGILKSIRKLQSKYLVRLACVRHAASVHPEPGSNSHVISFYLYEVLHEYYVKAQFEAEGFELPHWVVQVQNLAWLIFKPFYCFVRFCSECSHSWSKPKDHFYKNFQGFTYCSVFKELCFVVAFILSSNSFILSYRFRFVKNFLKLFFERLRSFLNDS